MRSLRSSLVVASRTELLKQNPSGYHGARVAGNDVEAHCAQSQQLKSTGGAVLDGDAESCLRPAEECSADRRKLKDIAEHAEVLRHIHLQVLATLAATGGGMAGGFGRATGQSVKRRSEHASVRDADEHEVAVVAVRVKKMAVTET